MSSRSKVAFDIEGHGHQHLGLIDLIAPSSPGGCGILDRVPAPPHRNRFLSAVLRRSNSFWGDRASGRTEQDRHAADPTVSRHPGKGLVDQVLGRFFDPLGQREAEPPLARSIPVTASVPVPCPSPPVPRPLAIPTPRPSDAAVPARSGRSVLNSGRAQADRPGRTAPERRRPVPPARPQVPLSDAAIRPRRWVAGPRSLA